MCKYKKMFENEVKGIFEDAEVEFSESGLIRVSYARVNLFLIVEDEIFFHCTITLEQSMKLNSAISNYRKYSQGGAIR